MAAERQNLFAYTEDSSLFFQYVGYLSLNREIGGSVTLTVHQAGDGAKQATITLPENVLQALARAIPVPSQGTP